MGAVMLLAEDQTFASSMTAPRTYSPEERIALITEIDARYRAGEGSLRAIAEKLGTTGSSFYNWRRAGLIAKPVAPEPVVAPKAKVQPSFSAADRARILAEVERRAKPGRGSRPLVRQLGSRGRPAGYRVEGLAVETLAQLLRALA